MFIPFTFWMWSSLWLANIRKPKLNGLHSNKTYFHGVTIMRILKFKRFILKFKRKLLLFCRTARYKKKYKLSTNVTLPCCLLCDRSVQLAQEIIVYVITLWQNDRRLARIHSYHRNRWIISVKTWIVNTIFFKIQVFRLGLVKR